ncbi:RTA1 like protein-domain-containing protein [Immersiella caudata]|uniref:RTA1 like protein-domain-containing protein n=1 Tax=Immersiella caudata TaxID=314043 RepID=A0AA39WIZ4_9PEZI|nr:RTA1 like protein-domain-containing protein [Immersiella caudata]
MQRPRDCTVELCQIGDGFASFQPAPVGNALMLAAFAVLIPVNIFTGIRYKTPLYASLIVTGLLVEILGHVAAVLLAANVTSHALFCVFMMGTLWGATLIGSANYLALPRVMVIYGREFSPVSKPVYCVAALSFSDVLALVLQSVGAAFASGGGTEIVVSQGVQLLIAGLVLQLASLVFFLGAYWYFRIKLSHRRFSLDNKFSNIFTSSRFSSWLLCMQVAAILLLVRAAVRTAALSGGFNRNFINSRITTFALDDTLVLLACIIITAAPVGRVFGSSWEKTSPFSSPEASVDLPWTLPPLSAHQRRLELRASISKPYPINRVFIPPKPRPGKLRQPWQPLRPNRPSPLSSPDKKPPYQRPAYDVSPAMPHFQTPKHSPTHFGQPSPVDGKPSWPLKSPAPSKLVSPNTLWG